MYKTKDGYKINQIDYINKIIKKYKMNKTKSVKKPSRNVIDFDRENSNLVNVGEYKSLLGTLLYITVKSRSDIFFAVNQASRNCENPTEVDYRSLIHILQYLKGTINKSICYNKRNRFIGYSDLDFASDEKTRRTAGDFIFLLGGSPIL